MTRIFEMRSAVLVFLTALALMGTARWSATDVFAQGASPAGSQMQPTAGGSMVEGKILNVSGAKVTLADGTELMIPSDVKVQRADLKPGATIKASFEEQGGQKVVTTIVVEPTK